MLSAFFAIVIPVGLCWAQSSEEAAGKTAEQAGQYREALGQYAAALKKTAEGNADEQRLREAAIRVTQKLSPPPALPEEAPVFSPRTDLDKGSLEPLRLRRGCERVRQAGTGRAPRSCKSPQPPFVKGGRGGDFVGRQIRVRTLEFFHTL